MIKIRKDHPLIWPAMATLLVLGWSSGFVGIRFTNGEASVFLLLFWRTLLSGLILLPFALAIGPRLNLKSIALQMTFGVMSVFVYLGGWSLAIEQGVPLGLVALVADMLPLAMVIISLPLLGDRLSKVQWAGIALAVFGVVIVSYESLTLGSAPLWAYFLTVASVVCFAFVSILHKSHKPLHLPVHQALCFQSLAGSLLFGICSLVAGDGLTPPMTAEFALGMAWLILIATFMTYAVYYTSLRWFSVAKVSAAIYLSPPVTMIWAWVLFNEPLTLIIFIGMAVTLVGVLITSQSQPAAA